MTENTTPIVAEFRLLARDYFRPVMALYRWNFWIIAAVIPGFLLAISAVAALMLGDLRRTPEALWFTLSGRAGIGVYALIALVLAAIPLSKVIQAGTIVLAIRAQPLRGKNYRVIIAEDGITATAQDLLSDLKWSSIREAGFTPSGFVLRLWTRQYLAIPRRAFNWDADYEAACAYVRAHLPPEAKINGR